MGEMAHRGWDQSDLEVAGKRKIQVMPLALRDWMCPLSLPAAQFILH